MTSNVISHSYRKDVAGKATTSVPITGSFKFIYILSIINIPLHCAYRIYRRKQFTSYYARRQQTPSNLYKLITLGFLTFIQNIVSTFRGWTSTQGQLESGDVNFPINLSLWLFNHHRDGFPINIRVSLLKIYHRVVYAHTKRIFQFHSMEFIQTQSLGIQIVTGATRSLVTG
jgi:hypothetical protein